MPKIFASEDPDEDEEPSASAGEGAREGEELGKERSAINSPGREQVLYRAEPFLAPNF